MNFVFFVLILHLTFFSRDEERHRDRDNEKEEKKPEKKMSIFEQFNIPKPQIQLNPFTGKTLFSTLDPLFFFLFF